MAGEVAEMAGEMAGESVAVLAEAVVDFVPRLARGATSGPRGLTGCLRIALMPAISVAKATRRFAGIEYPLGWKGTSGNILESGDGVRGRSKRMVKADDCENFAKLFMTASTGSRSETVNGTWVMAQAAELYRRMYASKRRAPLRTMSNSCLVSGQYGLMARACSMAVMLDQCGPPFKWSRRISPELQTWEQRGAGQYHSGFQWACSVEKWRRLLLTCFRQIAQHDLPRVYEFTTDSTYWS